VADRTRRPDRCALAARRRDAEWGIHKHAIHARWQRRRGAGGGARLTHTGSGSLAAQAGAACGAFLDAQPDDP